MLTARYSASLSWMLGIAFLALTAFSLQVCAESPDKKPQPNPPIQAGIDSLRAELNRLAGTSSYIVIDRPRNRLVVRQPQQVLLEATCATGSGMILFGDKHNQTWHVRTPRRIFTVKKKVIAPIWKKPTWAFVEKNIAAPVLPWEFSRLDGTTLGSYALELQDSYAIHGTLYPSLLGRSITHGCVRLDDEALTRAYQLSPLGTKVYVF